MNLKFPLLNLISRGHLPLSNKTESLNFVKSLEDGPATKICYEMLKFDNPKDSASYLERVQAAFLAENNSVSTMHIQSEAFTSRRDLILMRESYRNEQQEENAYAKIRSLLVGGSTAAALSYFITRKPSEQEMILKNLKLTKSRFYNLFADNYVGRKLNVPVDGGDYFERLAKRIVGYKGNKKDPKQWLSNKENKTLDNFFRKAKVGTAIAAGTGVGIVALSLIYKKFFSAEARACANLFGKERTVCMTQARIKACEAAIAKAKEGLLECNSAKNEEDCIFKMKVEIRSWSKKKAIEEEKLRKLNNVNQAAFADKSNDPFGGQ